MSSEWEVERLDLDAYLKRVGYRGGLRPDKDTLVALHRAHVASVPFENLDVVLGRGVSVDLGDVQAKLVGGGRGGYCYEHGVLFAAVLEQLGFRVDRLLARIGANGDRPRPRTHMTLHVYAGDDEFLADVGFGAGLLEPLEWRGGGAHRQGGWTYRLAGGGETWEVQERQGDDWVVLYSFRQEPQHLSDVVMSNHFTSTHPSSPFSSQMIVMRKGPQRRLRLLGRRLSVSGSDGSSEEHELTDDEIALALHDDFGLFLDAEEIALVVASLPPADG